MNRYILRDIAACRPNLSPETRCYFYIVGMGYHNPDCPYTASKRVLVARDSKDAYRKWYRRLSGKFKNVLKKNPDSFRQGMSPHSEAAIFYYIKNSELIKREIWRDRHENIHIYFTFKPDFYNDVATSSGIEAFYLDFTMIGEVGNGHRVSKRFETRRF